MQELQFPFKSKSFDLFQIVGSCNGLFCLSDDYHGIILWNLSIKKYLSLPKPHFTRGNHWSFTSRLGFGFDIEGDDYKVVRMAYAAGEHGTLKEVELYTVKSGFWRRLSAGALPVLASDYWTSPAFVNGAVHWVGWATSNMNLGLRALILSFDMSTEEFRVVDLPQNLQQCRNCLSVAMLGEKLGLLKRDDSGPRMQIVSMWVMEEYGLVESWRNVYAGSSALVKVLRFTNHGKILGVSVRGKLVLFDPNTGVRKGLGVRGAK